MRRLPILLVALVFTLPGFCAADTSPGARDLAPAVIRGEFTTGPGGIQGAGESLTFPSPGRYRHRFGTCVKPDTFSTGRAGVRDGKLILLPRTGERETLTPVEWGPRTYLVRDLLKFVNDVNAGIEPRDDEWGAAFLRVADWKKPVAGLPPLPAPFSRQLLPAPADGKVTEVKPTRKVPPDQESISRATTDLGADNGVFVGMVLWADGAHQPFPATVVSVDQTSALVEARWATFKLGQKVTSLRPRR
jgi:hypothetical protein